MGHGKSRFYGAVCTLIVILYLKFAVEVVYGAENEQDGRI